MLYQIKREIIWLLMKILHKFRRFLYRIFCFFIPINNKKIVFNCHQGRGMGDNPKYIAKEILKQNLDYELVWLCHPKHIDETFIDGIKVVDSTNKFKKLKELANAKVWVESSIKTPEIRLGLIKRKGQIYINTWHGSLGIKKMYYDMDIKKFDKMYLNIFNKDIENIDYMISNCDWESNIYKSALHFNKEIKLFGHPRNDIFFEDYSKYKDKVCKKLKISSDKKIVLYMPSFRDNFNIKCYSLDYLKVKKVIEEKFGDNWVFVSRFHNVNLRKNNKIIQKYPFDIDASFYPDAQELLVSADILISDYSSCMFDYMLLKRPCFIFATDINEYNTQRGFYYSLEKTPFLIAKNNDEMIENIKKFNLKEYQKNCSEFLSKRNVFEDGCASKRCVKFIDEIINS